MAPGKLVWALEAAGSKEWLEATVTGKPAGGQVDVELAATKVRSPPASRPSRVALPRRPPAWPSRGALVRGSPAGPSRGALPRGPPPAWPSGRLTCALGATLLQKTAKLPVAQVRAMDAACRQGVDDMTRLTDLFEGSLMRNLRIRFQADQIYVRLRRWPATGPQSIPP